MSKNRRALAGLEYIPVTEPTAPDVGFGVIRRSLGELTNDTRAFVWKKLHPIGRSATYLDPWKPSAWRHDVLLPSRAPDDYDNAWTLCDRYEEQSFDTMKDLIIMTTLRFPGTSSLHADWEAARSFARQRLAIDRQLAVVLAMHNPRVAGGSNAAHVHIMALARELDGSGFGPFVRPLASDRGRQVMMDEWEAWKR